MTTSHAASTQSARAKSLKALWRIIEPKVPASRNLQMFGEGHIHIHGHGASFNSEQALRILKRGISSKVIAPLSEYLMVGKGDLVLILDLDRTTALRRAGKDQPLPMHSAESVLRLLELKELANDTFETEDVALGWLRRPHPMLDGETPLESAKTSFGSKRVKDILVAIKHGGVV